MRKKYKRIAGEETLGINKKMRATRFELATLGFGVQRSTVGATPSSVKT
jgi:hypothetical protein